mmetsp:Transcript_37271/g.49122  ORF Transcript_37271/g.49122 Transcript_37271/m.49122 type:complete len:223 (+) Transcript_37271:105-773(+)
MDSRSRRNGPQGLTAHHLDTSGNLGRNTSSRKLFHPSLVPSVPNEEVIEAVKHVPEGDDIPEGPFIVERVQIPMYETIDRVVYYVIEVTAQDGTMYNIRRRYRDFDKFHREHSHSFSKVCPASLPPKGGLADAKIFQVFSCLVELQADLEIRRRALQKYLERLVRFAKTRAGDAAERVGQLMNNFLEFYAYYAPSVKELQELEILEAAWAPHSSPEQLWSSF